MLTSVDPKLGLLAAGSLTLLLTTTLLLRRRPSPSPPPAPLENDPDAFDLGEDARGYVAEATLALTKQLLMPLNQALRGPLERRPDFRTQLPFVFVLGNHSSGKSSFINYVLGKKVQEAGVAPTDDGFSIIMPGQADVDMDGPSLVGSPDFGFSGLRTFGSGLVEHVRLKIRSQLGLQEVILIDSPGMIDSPADSVTFNVGKEKRDRGYDFEGVARWFAERADVILLFFDPDKPGTTGETLSVLTNALNGMDHKLLIVLNKVDMFQRSADFARSYGALCWNLAKVIPRKDLPRIYTTYTPFGTDTTKIGAATIVNGELVKTPVTSSSIVLNGSGKAELDAVRAELVNEIKLTPFRRMDNMITTLFDHAKMLQMHAQIMSDAKDSYNREKWNCLFLTFGGGSVGVGSLIAAVNHDADSVTLGAAVGLTAVPTLIGLLYGLFRIRAKRIALETDDSYLDTFFRKRFKQELAEKDESVNNVWARVKPQIIVAIEHFGVVNLPNVPQDQVKQLDVILHSHVPALRRRAAMRFSKAG